MNQKTELPTYELEEIPEEVVEGSVETILAAAFCDLEPAHTHDWCHRGLLAPRLDRKS